MKLSDMTENQKRVLSELEEEVGFSLEKEMEDNKFLIMDWKWVVKCNDMKLYNFFAEKFEGDIVKNRFESKSFEYELPTFGPYNFWYNI